MFDRPDAATLLKAMAATLTNDVLPETSGGTRHAVRVVANLCRILEREFEVGPDASERTRLALTEFLGHDGSLSELISEFDQLLSEREIRDDTDFDSKVRELILADVERRLAIDRPGYAS